jgi:hypothetical protein
LARWAGVRLNECFDRRRQLVAGKINAPLNLACDIALGT